MHTLSVLTITSNVVYGKKTGSTPDGRKKASALRPWRKSHAQPGDKRGALASLNSVAKLSYDDTAGTAFPTPSPSHLRRLGNSDGERVQNLATVLGGYFKQMAHHINVNVLNKEKLMEAYEQSRDVPQSDHPGFRLCRQLPQAVERAAAGGHQPHLPRRNVTKMNENPSPAGRVFSLYGEEGQQ